MIRRRKQDEESQEEKRQRRIRSFRNARLDEALEAIATKNGLTAAEILGNRDYENILRMGIRQFEEDYWGAVQEDHGKFRLEFEHLLKSDKPFFPRQWMMDDPQIWAAIGPEGSKFIMLFLYLWESTLRFDESRELANEMSLRDYITDAGEVRHHVLIADLDYRELAKELNEAEITTRKRINAFVKADILDEMGKRGPRGQMIYAIGYFHPWQGKHLAKPLIKKTAKMVKTLREFRWYG